MPAKDPQAYAKQWYKNKKAKGFDTAAQSKKARQKS